MTDSEYTPSIPELQEAWISTYARDGQLTESAILRGQREFKGWLAAHDAEVARAAAEKAWDDGHRTGGSWMGMYATNPYRLEQTDEQ